MQFLAAPSVLLAFVAVCRVTHLPYAMSHLRQAPNATISTEPSAALPPMEYAMSHLRQAPNTTISTESSAALQPMEAQPKQRQAPNTTISTESSAALPPMEAQPKQKGIGDVKEFAKLLPFHPMGQPESMFKTRCINFVNHLLEKSDNNPELVVEMLPKCQWDDDMCDKLKADLEKRLKGGSGGKESALLQARRLARGAGAGAPAAADGKEKQESAGPTFPLGSGSEGPKPKFLNGDAEGGLTDEVYGWCGTMYDMLKTKALDELTQAGAPGPAPASSPAM